VVFKQNITLGQAERTDVFGQKNNISRPLKMEFL
jgi:hypothetical protein